MNFAAVRNVAIIAGIAAVVDLVPGGGTAASVVLQAVSLVFLAALLWVAGVVYRDHRNSLYSLGERRRAVLYGSIVVLAVTLTATSRLWTSAIGQVAWLVLIAASLYAGGSVLWSARRV